MPAKVLYRPIVALCLLNLSWPAIAQNCRITGSITDSRHTPVATAIVTVIQVDTGSTRQVLSNARGHFQLAPMPPGEYRIEAERPGFKSLSRTHVILQSGSTAIIELHMELQMDQTHDGSLLAYICGLSPGSGCELLEPGDPGSMRDPIWLSALLP